MMKPDLINSIYLHHSLHTATSVVDGYLKLTALEGVGDYWIRPDMTALRTTGNVYNVDTGERSTRGIDNVSGLNANGPLSVAYLTALAVKPVFLPTDILLAAAQSLEVKFLNNTLGEVVDLTPSNVYWTYPDGGIEVEGNTEFKYLPMFSKYAVNSSGDFILVSTSAAITSGTNRAGTLYLMHDCGDLFEVETDYMVLAAHGRITLDTMYSTIYYTDGDTTNHALANLTLTIPVDNDGYVELTDLTTDKLVDTGG